LLLVSSPGRASRVVEESVSLLDVAPAVLAELSLPPHGNFQGRGDILAPGYRAAGRPFAFTLQGLVQQDGLLLDDLKLIVEGDRIDRRLFDLATDPGERHDLAGERPDLVAALQSELDAFLARQLDYYRDEGWRKGLYPPALP
ncbi:MAG: hypothetical protein ACRD0X_02920, partial [Thermoanaerobaculia bacterium]